MRWPSAARLLACCLMMTFAGCSSIPKQPGPSLKLSDACERLPGKIALSTFKAGTNAKSSLGGAVKTLNDRIAAKDQCYRNQRRALP